MTTRLLTAALSMTIGTAANAAIVNYNLTFTGDQEVPGPGDSDGFGSGTLTVDDVTGDISWDITYGNISTVTGFHFHQAPAGSSAGVFLGLGTTTTGGANTLTNSTTTSTANALAINTNPENFYLNIHTTEFGPGAIRAQLPEPGSFALLALGGTMVMARRRRNA